MKRISLVLLAFAVQFVIAGCSAESLVDDRLSENNEDVDKELYLKEFAILLSSAVYNEPELRSFLKTEALKQVDNDYDVFYPWIKNESVDGSRSFRNILKEYDSKGLLKTIEENVPLLTIYIPDWKWLDSRCFSVTDWDVKDNEVAVSYRTKKADKPLFGNGKLLGTIHSGQYLDHPVLIIKQNERIIFSGIETKTGENAYSFVDSVFDGINNPGTKGAFYEEEYTFSPTEPNEWFSAFSLPSKVLAAYIEANNAVNMPQRDYIYYDMTSVRDTGALNIHYKERLYQFKLNPLVNPLASAWYDDHTEQGTDIVLNYHNSPGVVFSESQLSAMDWAEGNLELVFYFRAGDIATDKHSDVSVGQAFTPSKVFYKYYKNLFGTVTWRSYYTEPQYLVPKWIAVDHEFITWNLKTDPYRYTIAVEEHDSGAEVTRTMVDSYQYTTNVTTSVTTGEDIKYGYGTGMSTTELHSSTITETYTQSSDNLGSVLVQFSDPVVEGRNATGTRARLHVYSTGYVDLIIVPKNI